MSRSQKVVVKENTDFGTKQLPYEAPFAYFEHLPEKVWNKVQAEKQPAFWMLPAFRYSLAGLSVVMVLAWWVWNPASNSQTTQAELNGLATAEIADYLLQHSDPQGMVVMAQAEPLDWEEILPHHVALPEEEVLEWLDESEIIEAWEEI